MDWVIATVFSILGMLTGWTIVLATTSRKMIGTLKIDSSDPDDEPYMFLELSKDLNHIKKSRYAIMKVDTRGYLTRK